MDGTIAMLFLAASLGDMSLSYCQDGCVRRSEAQARLNFSVARVNFQNDFTSTELYASYQLPVKYGPFQPSLGASVTNRGAVWVGAGPTWERSFGDLVFSASLMPGLYVRGGGDELGSNFHFRAHVGVGYELANGARISVTYDHRSNADIRPTNPGLETLALRYSVPLR